MGFFLCRFILIATCTGFGIALSLLGARYPVPAAAFCLLLVYRDARNAGRAGGWSHGQARFASMLDLQFNHLIGGDRGVILGRAGDVRPPTRVAATLGLLSPVRSSASVTRAFLAAWQGRRWYSNRLIRLRKHVHLLTCAPSGRGKSTCVLVPNLLACLLSCVVVDPKGELYRLTSEHRRKMGHRVYCLDPFNICGVFSDTFNPMSFISATAPDFLEQCRDLANMLVLRTGKETDRHWLDSAELVLTAFIAFICACEPNPEERNFSLLREMVSSRETFAKAVDRMQQETGFDGVIKRLGDLLTWYVDKELGSVLTTVNRLTQFLDSPAIAANTATTSIDPMALKGGKCTIFLCLPLQQMSTLAAINRVWVGMLLRIITRGDVNEQSEVLFLIDEAAHIGKVQVLEDAVTTMRGCGIRIWLFFQSLTQLHECYGERATTILENLDTHQYFGVNGYFTANELSQRIGDQTIRVFSRNTGKSYSHPIEPTKSGSQGSTYSDSYNTTASDTGRRLLKPEEILTMGDYDALIFHRNLVIRAQLLTYFDAPEFKNGRYGQSGWKGGTLDACVTATVMLAVSVFVTLVAFVLAESHPTLRPLPSLPMITPAMKRGEVPPYPVPVPYTVPQLYRQPFLEPPPYPQPYALPHNQIPQRHQTSSTRRRSVTRGR